jgi:hypothetical protein
MSQKSINCTKCHGHGRHSVYVPIGNTRGFYTHELCPYCYGTGIIESKKSPDNNEDSDYETPSSSNIIESKTVNFEILGDCRIDRVGDNYTCFCIKADATFTFTVKKRKHSGFREIHDLTSCPTRLRVHGVYGRDHLLEILKAKIKQPY